LGIYNFIRAQTRPYPGAFTDLNGERLTIWGSRILDRPPRKGSPGEILTIVNAGPVKGVAVATADSDSALLLTEMQIGGDPVTLDRFTVQQKEIIGRKLGNG
jgi:methionyl-tRNA formyltransferase